MPRRRIDANGRFYVCAMDDAPPRSARFWGLLRARVIDELTGSPPLSPISCSADLAGGVARIIGDGVVGFVAVPRRVFPALAAAGYTVRVLVAAEGYLARRFAAVIPNDQRAVAPPAPLVDDTVMTLTDASRLSARESLLIGPAGPTMTSVRIRALGPGPNQVTVEPPLAYVYSVGDPVVPVVPDDFAPTNLGALPVHREPVTISGRTLVVTGGTVNPIGGVTVAVSGIWRQTPRANTSVPAKAPNIVSLQTPLYFDRTPAASLRRREVTQSGGDMILRDDAPQGSDILHLETPVNLGSPDLIAIDALEPDRHEHIQILNVTVGATPAHPVTVALAMPLARSHPRGAIVRKLTLGASGATNRFDQDLTVVDPNASAGDVCMLLDSMNDLDQPAPQTYLAEITGGAIAEYHSFKTLSVTSDAAGFFRLPPLSRVAQLEIAADRGSNHPVLTRPVNPDYGSPENRIELVFS